MNSTSQSPSPLTQAAVEQPSIEQFLSDLYRQDVQLWMDGERLRCNGPEEVLTDKLSQQLKARKAEIVAFLQQAAVQSPSSHAAPIPRLDRAENQTLPLSFAQQRLWFLDQMQQEGAVYNIPLAVKVQGRLDVALLQRCMDEIVQRHEALRTNFITLDGQPQQVVAAQCSVPIEQIDFRHLDAAEQEDEVRQLAIAAAQTRFDLTQDLLLKITLVNRGEKEFVVLFTLHHIISDGWSMELLLNELTQLYRAFLTGMASPLQPLPIQYADFAAWQRQWLQGEVLDKQLGYWRQQLGGDLPVLQLPTDFPRARIQTFNGAVVNFELSEATTNGLKALAQDGSATLFVTLLTAFKVLLYRYTGQTDLLVGTPTANRNRAEVAGLIGFFVNTLVLRSQLNPGQSFRELLGAVKATAWQGYEHQDLPFEKLVEELQPVRDLSYNPIFQVKFRLENLPQQSLDLPGLSLSPIPQQYATAKLDLSVDLYETTAGLVGGFEYNSDLFSAETMQRMVKHFEVLLTGIVTQPEQPIAELPLLTESEQQQIFQDWNDTERDYQRDRCFHQLFEAQVAKTPDAIALIFDQGNADATAANRLTYDELNRRSNQLAHQLQQLSIGPEVVVGICLPRSLEMIIALLAVLKAGGAYLPLDSEYPPERLSYMLNDAQVPLLLSRSDLSLQGIPAQTQRLDLDRHWPSDQPDHNPSSEVTPDNLAYLIYTSGSTGRPKGVLVPHNGLVNLTEDKIRCCDVRPNDCVLQFFSFSFDASIPEIVMSLGVGAKLLLAPAEQLLPGPGLARLLQRQAVTHITITPSALLSVPVQNFPALRMVLVGGEAPSPELIATWGSGRRFINAYGPTETTVNASMVACEGDAAPVLRPSTNKQLYILDGQQQLLPVGVLGELHIAGLGLARGYLNRPELTAEQFIPNPWINHPLNQQSSSPRLYRTGDLACYLPNGDIRILGRIDHQTKIRGFRIELGEVEAVLNQHPDVKATVVIVREDAPGDKRLVAYLVRPEADDQSATNGEQSASFTPGELRQFMAESLPHYMVPSAFVWLEALPLTANGKIDAKALPKPERVNQEHRPPRNSMESLLASIFQSVLNVKQLSIDDDFFELGGHSLLATQLVAQCLNQFEVELTVIDLFEAPNVAELAQRIRQKQVLEQLQSVDDSAAEDWEEVEL